MSRVHKTLVFYVLFLAIAFAAMGSGKYDDQAAYDVPSTRTTPTEVVSYYVDHYVAAVDRILECNSERQRLEGLYNQSAYRKMGPETSHELYSNMTYYGPSGECSREKGDTFDWEWRVIVAFANHLAGEETSFIEAWESLKAPSSDLYQAPPCSHEFQQDLLEGEINSECVTDYRACLRERAREHGPKRSNGEQCWEKTLLTPKCTGTNFERLVSISHEHEGGYERLEVHRCSAKIPKSTTGKPADELFAEDWSSFGDPKLDKYFKKYYERNQLIREYREHLRYDTWEVGSIAAISDGSVVLEKECVLYTISNQEKDISYPELSCALLSKSENELNMGCTALAYGVTGEPLQRETAAIRSLPAKTRDILEIKFYGIKSDEVGFVIVRCD